MNHIVAYFLTILRFFFQDLVATLLHGMCILMINLKIFPEQLFQAQHCSLLLLSTASTGTFPKGGASLCIYKKFEMNFL